MQTRFNFSSGGEFVYSDSTPFSGYFNINDIHESYTGKYFNEDSKKLINLISKYSSDYYRSDYYKDRFVFDSLVLPYNLEKILIQPNEIISFNILNTKIKYLHENILYMYSKMYMGSTDVPVDNDVNTLCNPIATNHFEWTTRPAGKIFGFGPLSAVAALSAYSAYDNIKSFVVLPLSDNEISILAISNTHLMGLTSTISNQGRLSGAKFVLYTNVIDNYSLETCKNLEDLTFDGEHLYITDSKINGGGQVFKYNINTFFTKDLVFEYKRFLVETIGGTGDKNRFNKFNGCSVIGSNQKTIWVYDSGNSIIKIFNKNFVWVKNIKIPDTRKYKILNIRNRKINNHMYVLYEDNYDTNEIKYGLFEYDENYNLLNTYIFDDVLYQNTDKSFKRIAFSEQDSNVFYAITNNTIFKKFFSRPEKTFAIFDRKKFYPDDTFQWLLIDDLWENLLDYQTWNYAEFFTINLTTHDIFVAASENNKDNLYFTGDTYISHLNESTEYDTVFRQSNLPYYTYNQIKFENMEYNQALTLNKEFFKLFQNVIQFKNNIKGKFFGTFNNYGDLLYKDYTYISNAEINDLDIELEYNSFVNDNELVQPNVINRIFTQIYDLQIKMLKITNPRLRNVKTWVDLKNGSNAYPIQ